MTYIHRYNNIHGSFTALKILCVLAIHLSLSSSLTTTDIFFSIVLPFPECLIVGIIQYVAFSDWLPSLSNMHLSFLHVFSWLDNSFLFSAENSIVGMDHSLFIHSLTEGHLGCFQVLAIMNKAAINIVGRKKKNLVQVFVWT